MSRHSAAILTQFFLVASGQPQSSRRIRVMSRHFGVDMMQGKVSAFRQRQSTRRE